MSYSNLPHLSTINPQPVDPSTINPQPESPSTLISQPSTFEFPPSVQSDLFNYLKPEQKQFIRPILRVLKKPAQEELCCSLMDYLETGTHTPPQDFTLSALYSYITSQWAPLRTDRTCEPKRIGDIIKGLLPFKV